MPTNNYSDKIASEAMNKYRESKHWKINQRMHFVYLKNKNYQNKTIADILSVTHKTICDWENIFNEGNLDALATLHYKGQPSQLNKYGKQIVFDFIKHPVATLKEAQHYIEKSTGIKRSLPQIRDFLKKNKIKRRKVGQIPDKADKEKQAKFKKHKLDRLIKLVKGGRIKLFFLDAAHFVHQPFLGYFYGIKRIFIRSSAGRKRFNILGALDAVTKNVTTICNETYINATTVCQLLELLAEQYIGEKIYIVLDNARYQHCQLVIDTAKRLKIHLIFLPAYSPNLNLIERLWRFTKKEVLYNKYYSTFLEFKNAITSCMKKINNGKYKNELDSLLTLKFQMFDDLQTNP